MDTLSHLAGVEVQNVADSLYIHPCMLSRWRKETKIAVGEKITMSNINKVRNFIAKFEALDLEGVMATFSDNAFYHNIPMEPLTGKEAIRGFIEPFMEPITAISWALHCIAEDDTGVVMTERVDTFVFGDKRVVMPVMGTFEFENDKLTRWRDYFDMRDFENQMAALQN